MELIALRIHVIAAFDAQFKTNPTFQGELMKYRMEMLNTYKKMVGGVHCGSTKAVLVDTSRVPEPGEQRIQGDSFYQDDYRIRVGCVDVYTGSLIQEYFLGSEILTENELPIDHRTFDPGRFNAEIAERKERLRRAVLLRMPLFEMRSLIDTLYLYAKPVVDVSGVDPAIPFPGGGRRDPAAEKADNVPIPRITVAEAPELCLDVQGGNPAAGTPVWLWRCHGGDAQHWVYDRPSGTIRNPMYDKCLDVQWGNPAPSTPVWTWDCIGSDAQKWTYDPETGVLQNALGTVLDIQPGDLQAQTPVRTWNRHEGPAQRWLVEEGRPRARRLNPLD